MQVLRELFCVGDIFSATLNAKVGQNALTVNEEDDEKYEKRIFFFKDANEKVKINVGNIKYY